MHMRIATLIVAAGALAISGRAQPTAGVAGPLTGFIFDHSVGAVRPMLGIPGAAYLGDAVLSGLAAASISPDGTAALAVMPGGKLMLVTGLRGPKAAKVAIPAAISNADRFAWHTSASAAAYSSHSQQAQILTHLDSAPQAAPAFELSNLPGPIPALLFDGQLLIVGCAGDAGAVVTASAAGLQRIATSPSPSAIAVSGTSLYFAEWERIVEVQNYATSPAVVPFATIPYGSPIGLEISADGKRLMLADSHNRTLAVYDIASRSAIQTLNLDFTPSRLDRFGDSSIYLMNGSANGPLYVVRDGGAGKAAVFFVPIPAKRHPVNSPVRPSIDSHI